MLSCQRKYGNSLGAVLKDPALSQLVRLESVGGMPHVLLLLDRLAGGVPSPAAAPKQKKSGTPPAAAKKQKKAVADSSNADASAAASAAEQQAARLAAVRAASGASPPQPRMVTSAAAAEAAVAQLLAAPEVAVDCEGSGQGLGRAGPISLVQLYAPEAGGAAAACCFVFDLVAMPEAERAGAMRHLARLLESRDVAKVRGGAASRVGEWVHAPGCSRGERLPCCPSAPAWPPPSSLCCSHAARPALPCATPRRCCTTAGATARRSSTTGASAARRCGTRRCGRRRRRAALGQRGGELEPEPAAEPARGARGSTSPACCPTTTHTHTLSRPLFPPRPLRPPPSAPPPPPAGGLRHATAAVRAGRPRRQHVPRWPGRGAGRLRPAAQPAEGGGAGAHGPRAAPAGGAAPGPASAGVRGCVACWAWLAGRLAGRLRVLLG